MAHICMVPSNALGSADRTKSSEASRFALRIIEMPIIHDYLAKTNGIPVEVVNHVPDEQDWWDTVNRRSYAWVLSTRHKKKPSFDDVMGVDVQWPDISTYDGPWISLLGSGGVVSRRRGHGRHEMYEIKPNNKQGLRDALNKLRNVERSYGDFKIAGIYQRGAVYPLAGRTTIQLQPFYLNAFMYLVNLAFKPLGVTVQKLSIEVERPEAGVLLYKICVDLDGADRYQPDSQFLLANFAVRLLLEVDNEYQPIAVREAATAYANALVPDDPAVDPRRVEPVFAGRDLRKTPYLTLSTVSMAGELAPRLGEIRDAMYSRLMGTPGDRYLLCADAAWYEQNVRRPGVAKAQGQVQTIKFAPALSVTNGLGFVVVAAPIILTPALLTSLAALSSMPTLIPAASLMLSATEGIDAKTVLIVLGCAVVITAAIIATLVTLGADAPVTVPVIAGAATVAEGTVATGAVATGEAALGGVLLTEAGGVAAGGTSLGASIMTPVAGAEAAGIAAVPVTVATETSAAVTVQGVSPLAYAQAAFRAGSTATELAEASAQGLADRTFIEALQQTAFKAALSTAGKIGVRGATVGVVGLSASTAHAYTGPKDGPLAVEKIGPAVVVEVGTLYAVRVPPALPTQVPVLPKLYDEVNLDDYVLLPSEKSGRRMVRMLGCVTVD